jgi:ABC-type phosphate transport system substrate-binding protein
MMNNVIRSLAIAAVLGTAVPALAEVVVVVHPSAPQASMTRDEVAQYFLGKSTALAPVDQPESAPVRAEFYKKVTDKDMSQVKALWSKLVFTGKATMPKEVGSSADVRKAVAANPKAIGYIEKSAVDATVKVIYTAP